MSFYRKTFRAYDGLALGNCVLVEFKETSIIRTGPHNEYTITADVRLTQQVELSSSPCSVCGTRPTPDIDAARYMLANAEAGRICFSAPEAAFDKPGERDTWPVTGWSRIRIADRDLLCCESCAKKVGEGIDDLAKKLMAEAKKNGDIAPEEG